MTKSKLEYKSMQFEDLEDGDIYVYRGLVMMRGGGIVDFFLRSGSPCPITDKEPTGCIVQRVTVKR